MAKTRALVYPRRENKSFQWYNGLSGCLESSKAVITPTKKKRKDSNPPDSSTEEEDEDEPEVFDKLAEQIEIILDRVLGQDEEWQGTLASGLIYSAHWIDSLSRNSRTVYDNLKSTVFEDVAKTTAHICTILAKTHWAAGGLLVVAAILENIQRVHTVDKKCKELLRSIHTVAVSLNRLHHLPRTPREMQHNLNRAQLLIPRGTALCLQIIQSTGKRKFLSVGQNDRKISNCRKELDDLQKAIEFQLVVALYAEPRETSGSFPKEDKSEQRKTGTTDDKDEDSGKKPVTQVNKDPRETSGSLPKADTSEQRKIGKRDEKDVDSGKEPVTQLNKEDAEDEGGSSGKGILDKFWDAIHSWSKVSCSKLIKHSSKSKAKPQSPINTNSQDPTDRVKQMLDLESHDKAIAVFVFGSEDTGKGDFADEVCSKIGDKEWIILKIDNSKIDDSVKGLAAVRLWRREIIKELQLKGGQIKGKEAEIIIESDEVWQRELSGSLPKENSVLIYLDKVPAPEILKLILPKNLALKTRLLVTVDNKNVMSALDGSKFKKEIYVMQPLSYDEALEFLRKKFAGLDEEKFVFQEIVETPQNDTERHLLPKIVNICRGYKNQMKMISDKLLKIKDKTYFSRLSDWIDIRDRSYKELQVYICCQERLLDLPEHIKDAHLDICSFFNNWEWTKIASILGNDVLKKLEELELLKRESYRVSVPYTVREFGLSLSKGNRVNNVADLYTCLSESKKRSEIKGIWLSENKVPFYLSSSQLDDMHTSLRVLALGDHTMLKGECTETFKELRYFQVGKVKDHPFNMKNLNQPSFLENISNKDMGLASEKVQIPSTLRMVILKADKVEDCLNLQEHVPKACKIVEVDISKSNVNDLRKEFCELHALEKLILNNCNRIVCLPERFGKLRSLKMLDLSHCTELTSLPPNFGWLSALEKVNLSYCKNLKDLPDSMGLLSSVTEIDLSYCKKIEKLPKNIVKLSKLYVFLLRACSNLCELPEGFENLSLKTLSLESCKRLKALPQGTGQQTLSETVVSLSWCFSISELSISFVNLIKTNVEHLILADCTGLMNLPEEFTSELGRLKTLNLSGCRSLCSLPKRLKKLEYLEKLNLSSCVKLEESSILLRRLPSLREINLSNCPGLKGSCLKRLSALKSLKFVDIHDSPYLVERWEQMIRERTDCNFTAATGQPSFESPPFQSVRDFPDSGTVRMTTEKYKFFNDKWFFANASGQPFYPSTLEEGTTVAVIFYRSYDKEELLALGNMLDDLHIGCKKLQALHVGRSVTALPRELAGRHLICSCDNHEALVFFEQQLWTTESYDKNDGYLMIVSEVVISDNSKAFGLWRSITNSSLMDFNVALPTTEYFHLKELIETPQSSNAELLQALLLTKETTFLIKKDGQVGIKDLTEKFIFLLISWLDKFEDEQECFVDVYKNLKKKFDKSPRQNNNCFEMVWIPIVSHGRATPALHARLVQRIEWTSIANPWSINPSAKRFLRMHYSLDKLPLFIAISPKGQIHFENFIPQAEDNGIEALYSYINLSNSE